MWKALRITIGIILLVIGIIALVTPLTPGAWLGLIGLELLGWGFLIPKPARDFWEKSSVNVWLEKKFKGIGYPQRGSESPVPASHHVSKDNPPNTSPPSA
jgi:hypothetical protein